MRTFRKSKKKSAVPGEVQRSSDEAGKNGFGTKKKTPAQLDRDFIVVESEKHGPGAALQTHVKKLAKLGAVVEFKKIPKLKNTRDSDPKFKHVLTYRLRQCHYLFRFQQEEEDTRKLIDAQDITPGAEGVELAYIAAQKRTRKVFRDSANHHINDTILKSRTGIIKTIQSRKDKKKKRIKQRSKDPEENAKFLKAEVLQQVQEYISLLAEYKPKIDDSTMHALIGMISINLFVPSTKKGYVPAIRTKNGSGRFVWESLDIPGSSWTHRAIVYQIVIHLILCYNAGNAPSSNERASKEFRDAFDKYVNQSFISHMINTLQSTDQLERETIQVCIKLLCEHCPHLSPLVWRVMEQAINGYSSDGQWDVGVASTMIVSILNLAETLDHEQGVAFVSKTLLPLYKAPFEVIVRYHPVLFRLVTKLLRNNHELIKPVILRLLKCWPVQSTSKQLLFLEQLSAIFLEVVARTSSTGPDAEAIPPQEQWFYEAQDMKILMSIHGILFNRICTVLEGEHYEVSVAAIRILDHPAVFFPFVLAPKVPEPKTLPDGSTEVRDHPVLSRIYRSFRRVVANHDYMDVRKTINTLMGLLEDHWSDVCENEIRQEEIREDERKKRREEMERVIEIHGHYTPADVRRERHLSQMQISLERSPPSPRNLNRDDSLLESLENLNMRMSKETVSNHLLVPGKRGQRAASISVKSEILSKEKHRRKNSLVANDIRTRRKTEPAGIAKTDEHKRAPRKNSFELMLKNKTSALAVVNEDDEERGEMSYTRESTRDDDEDDDEVPELDLDHSLSSETLRKIDRRQKSFHDHDFDQRLRTMSNFEAAN